jgi:hypothetical protein
LAAGDFTYAWRTGGPDEVASIYRKLLTDDVLEHLTELLAPPKRGSVAARRRGSRQAAAKAEGSSAGGETFQLPRTQFTPIELEKLADTLALGTSDENRDWWYQLLLHSRSASGDPDPRQVAHNYRPQATATRDVAPDTELPRAHDAPPAHELLRAWHATLPEERDVDIRDLVLTDREIAIDNGKTIGTQFLEGRALALLSELAGLIRAWWPIEVREDLAKEIAKLGAAVCVIGLPGPWTTAEKLHIQRTIVAPALAEMFPDVPAIKIRAAARIAMASACGKPLDGPNVVPNAIDAEEAAARPDRAATASRNVKRKKMSPHVLTGITLKPQRAPRAPR